MRAQPNNLVHLNRDVGYRFREVDPDMEWITGKITESKLTCEAIAELVAKATKGAYKVCPGTIYNWQSGRTKRPQNFTLTWVAYALSYERSWKKRRA